MRVELGQRVQPHVDAGVEGHGIYQPVDHALVRLLDRPGREDGFQPVTGRALLEDRLLDQLAHGVDPDAQRGELALGGGALAEEEPDEDKGADAEHLQDGGNPAGPALLALARGRADGRGPLGPVALGELLRLDVAHDGGAETVGRRGGREGVERGERPAEALEFLAALGAALDVGAGLGGVLLVELRVSELGHAFTAGLAVHVSGSPCSLR